MSGANLSLLLRKLLRSGALRTGVAFAASAVAFALANLIFASHLPPATYGSLALLVAIIAVGGPLAPLGLAIIVVREHLPAEPRLLFRCGVTSVLIAGAAASVGSVVYALAPAEVAVVAVAVAGGGFIRLGSGMLQRDGRFVTSSLTSESMSFLLLAAAMFAVVSGITSALWPLVLVAVAQLVLAGAIWAPLLAADSGSQGAPPDIPIPEMLLLTGTHAATLLLLQVERLALPMFLNTETLAAFAVLAVFTIAPFRPIEVGTNRTLIVWLRRASTGPERRRLLLREAAHVIPLLAAIGLVLATLTPLVLAYLFHSKYQFSVSATLAGIAGGQLRVVRSMIAAAISALADRRGLAVWNAAAWASVGAAFLGGWVGSAWGLEGFLWGVALGGVTNVILTLPLLPPHLR